MMPKSWPSALRLTVGACLCLALAKPRAADAAAIMAQAAGWSYEDILRAYQTGDASAAVAALAAWDEADVRRAYRAAQADASVKIQLGEGAVLDAHLAAIAALHLEAGIATRDRRQFVLHVGMGESAVRGLASRRSLTAFCRTWFLAVAGYQVLLGALPDAEKTLNGGRQLLGDSPGLLVGLGSVQEAWSGPLGGDRPDFTNLAPRYRMEALERREPTALLRRARDFYDKALGIDPAYDEARLRLGRVQQLLGNREQAAKTLAQCATAATRRHIQSLADLFLGGLLEDGNDYAGAEAAYRRAAEAADDAFAARLALARVLDLRGEGDAAARTIRDALGREDRRGDGTDPWTLYQLGQLTAVSTQLEELRTTARGSRGMFGPKP